MTHRERFFKAVLGEPVDRVPYFPDITDWYVGARAPGEAQKYPPGGFIPDEDAEFHARGGVMPAEFRDFTFLDFYRRFDWGLPIHLYDWYDVEYDGVEVATEKTSARIVTTWRCAKGELRRTKTLAADGSYCPTEMPVKSAADLEIFRFIAERSRPKANARRIADVLAGIGEQGVLDLVIPRSPFGKLVHELIGFEDLVYQLHDDPTPIREWLAFQEERDFELIRLARDSIARIIIISDHTDENLISPPQYREFCVPFYQKATACLHQGRKLVSTHLDGNIKGYFPILKETGVDLLDGCTPRPMTNYTPRELAETDIAAYCGVPSTLFCHGTPVERVLEAGREILDAFRERGRLVLNVGDILPPNGDIQKVIQLGNLTLNNG